MSQLSTIYNKKDKVAAIKHMIKKTSSMTINLAALLSLALFDLLAIGIAVIFAYILRNLFLPLLFPSLFTDKLLEHTFNLLWWYPMAFILTLAYEKLYQKRLPFWTEVALIIKASTLAFFLGVAFIYIFGLSNQVSRAMVILIWIFNLFLLPTLRFYGKKLLFMLDIWHCPALLIGDKNTAALLQGALNREITMGYKIIGLIDTHKQTAEEESEMHENLPVLGLLPEAELIIQYLGVRNLIIAVPGMLPHDLNDLINRFRSKVDNIIIAPDLFGTILNSIDIAYLIEEQAILLQIRNRLKSPFNRVAKRLFDILLGCIFFIISLPILIAGAIIIKLDSAGPVLHIQKRIGQGATEFYVYKFRTMYNNADRILERHLAADSQSLLMWQQYQKLKDNDPRVTKVGRFLRRFSLDELPQLINVLKGDMSLVGPRPYLPREKCLLSSWAQDIYVTNPGLTGLWQVSGRNELSFDSRLKLDSWYVRNWSLWFDVVLLLKTPRVVLKSKGAY